MRFNCKLFSYECQDYMWKDYASNGNQKWNAQKNRALYKILHYFFERILL